MIEDSVKLFRQKIKELASYVEANGPDEYVSVDFLAFLNDIKELTEIVRIDLVRSRAPAAPVFHPNSEYVPVSIEEATVPLVVEGGSNAKENGDVKALDAKAPDLKEHKVPDDIEAESGSSEVSKDSPEVSLEKPLGELPEVVGQTKASTDSGVAPKSKTKPPKV